MKIASVLSLFLLCVSCITERTSKSLDIKEVESSDYDAVSNCTKLRDLEGFSSHGGYIGRETGIVSAKNSVMNQAAEVGATHVMWRNIDGFMSVEVRAVAYDCDDEQSSDVGF